MGRRYWLLGLTLSAVVTVFTGELTAQEWPPGPLVSDCEVVIYAPTNLPPCMPKTLLLASRAAGVPIPPFLNRLTVKHADDVIISHEQVAVRKNDNGKRFCARLDMPVNFQLKPDTTQRVIVLTDGRLLGKCRIVGGDSDAGQLSLPLAPIGECPHCENQL